MTPPTIGAIRVSREQQADKYGPDRQRQDVIREAEQQGLTITDWVEESISGTDHARAAENRYYDLARHHPGVNVIFSHPNRVGRHVEVTVGIARTIHQLGGTVWIAGMGSLRDKRTWKYFLRDAAEAESDHSDIVERLQRGKYDKATKNRWPHGAAPYGYRIVRDDNGKSVTLEPHPERAPVVQRIFQRALAGDGTGTIAADLTRAGILSPRAHKGGGHWTHRAVLYTLANEAYTGRREFTGPGGEVAVVTFPALVSPTDFQQARAAVKGRSQHRPARTTRPALFAGHLRCGACGGGMNVQANKRAGYREYLYYRCVHASRSPQFALVRGGRMCDYAKGWRVDSVDPMGWELFTAAMTDPVFLAAAVRREQPATPDHTGRIAEVQQQMAELVRRAVTHHLSEDVVQLALQPLRDELAHLEQDQQPRAVEVTPDMTELASSMAAYLPTLATLQERRDALDTWGVRLMLVPDGEPRLEVTLQGGRFFVG